MEAGQLAQACHYANGLEAYQEKHRCYPAPKWRVVALEEEGAASADPTSEEDSESEVEAVDGLNMCLAQAMSCYQREEQKCFMCGSPGHFARDWPHRDFFKRWHWEQLNVKGAGSTSSMHLKNGSGRVSLMVRNMSDSHIFLKKGVPVVKVVLASPVPPTDLSPEVEATLGTEAKPEPMLVMARQEKLLEKLNLDGLAHWSPRNAVVARELVLAYHDIFVLESNELGCTSAIKHEIRINNSEPFKGWFRCIPPPLLDEVHTSLWDMLDAGVIHSSQSPWCNTVVLVRKKDGTLCFCIYFRCLNAWMTKDLYPLPHIQEALESMVGSAHFLSMDFKSGFWQIKMAPESQQYTAFKVGNL